MIPFRLLSLFLILFVAIAFVLFMLLFYKRFCAWFGVDPESENEREGTSDRKFFAVYGTVFAAFVLSCVAMALMGGHMSRAAGDKFFIGMLGKYREVSPLVYQCHELAQFVFFGSVLLIVALLLAKVVFTILSWLNRLR